VPSLGGSPTYLKTSFSQAYAQKSPPNSEERALLTQQFQEELDTWVLRAYDGDSDAQFKVGVLFTNDQFTAPDFEQAIYWYKQAAEQGHVLAQYNLGHQYLNGVGVEKSDETAMQWWLKAAKQEHPLAQFNVGRAYYLGIGLSEDHTQAKYWFKRAASNQEEKSIEILTKLDWNQETDPKNTTQTAQTEPKQSSAEPNTKAAQNALEAATTTDKKENDASKSAIALYTDPSIRSLLISIADDSSKLRLIKKSGDWSHVKHEEGFPVWVHTDFLSVSDDHASVLGNNVNARSIPMIVRGSIVGQLNKSDRVRILNLVGEWYRIVSPTRLTAWVRSSDYHKPAKDNGPTSQQTPQSSKTPAKKTKSTQHAPSLGANDWLFSQPASNYTIQLASLDTPQKAASYLNQSKLKNDPRLHQLSATSNNINWTYFVYGSYSDREMAATIKNKLRDQRVWPRNLGKLQESRCVSWKKQIPAPKELNIYCKP